MSGIIKFGAFAATSLSAYGAGGQISSVFSKESTGFSRPPARGTDDQPLGKTSRRRRLWELSHKYHCPLIGVCFDVTELRKTIGKVLRYPADTTDYVWHTIAVGVCDTRCPLSEQFNRILDQRFAPVIRRMAGYKTANEVRSAWREACRQGVGIPAALWAASTHPACSDELEQEIHADIHMIQHQVGAGARLDLEAMQRLQAENTRLKDEILASRKRQEQQRVDHVRASQELAQRVVALQTELSAREAATSRLQSLLDHLQAAMPDLDDRQKLASRLLVLEASNMAAREREKCLEREVARLRDFAVYAEETIEALTKEIDPDGTIEYESLAENSAGTSLLGKSVLCVGGRSGAVTSYREVVEQHGGRFMHHDGGREESLHRIDGVLAAADIVICQVGCISHNAYWRVKEQCKRTGKPCMFVRNSGLSSFGRIINEASGKADGVGLPTT